VEHQFMVARIRCFLPRRKYRKITPYIRKKYTTLFHPLSIDQNLNNDQCGQMIQRIETNGFCLLNPTYNMDVEHLKRFSSQFGIIQKHARGDSGVVNIISKETHTSPLTHSNPVHGDEEFLLHTDGSYIEGLAYEAQTQTLMRIIPPKIVILHCTKRANEGGETTLLDAKKLLEDICEQESIEFISTLFKQGSIAVWRGQHIVTGSSYFVRHDNGNYEIRYHYDKDLYCPEWSVKVIEKII